MIWCDCDDVSYTHHRYCGEIGQRSARQRCKHNNADVANFPSAIQYIRRLYAVCTKDGGNKLRCKSTFMLCWPDLNERLHETCYPTMMVSSCSFIFVTEYIDDWQSKIKTCLTLSSSN